MTATKPITLRDYQAQAVEDIRAAIAHHYRRPLYVAPTGSGKTVLFSYIARNAAAKGKRVCILVHRRELVHQTCLALGYDHGVIAAGFVPCYHEQIQVASVQTLVNRADRTAHFDLIVVDEAHHTRAATWERVLAAYPRAHVLGVTATPCRLDGKGLGDVFDTLIQGPSVQDLTDQGYLSPAEVYAPAVIDTSHLHTRMGDYVKGEMSAAIDKPKITGDVIAHYRRYADGLPAIAFCVSVQHAQHVADQFRKHGYQARSIDGKTKRINRDAAIADLARGGLDVLTSCDLVSEGVDVPVAQCGIMLRPTQSLGLAMQQMGRLLRIAPGKERAIILDHAGNCLRHGLPATPREWTLESGAGEQRQQGEAVDSVRQCQQCFCVHAPAPRCPHCGYVYPLKPREVEQADGELEKLDAVEVRKASRREQGRASTLEELTELGQQRGYKNPRGWAKYVWTARQRRATA